tara:strand:+ start:39 stop:1064 length:1026 start_codon:yes stop_codon:yes gene_type:complete
VGGTVVTTQPAYRSRAIFRDIVTTTASTRNLTLLSRPFRSAGMLEGLFQQLGFQMQVVQISRGPLQGHLSATRSAGGLLLQLTTNQCLSCSGSRNQRWLAIALEQTNNLEMHRLRGEAVKPCSVQGFNRNLTESIWQVSPHSHLSLLVIPVERIFDLIALDPSSTLQEVIDTSNVVTFQPSHFKTLKTFLLSSDIHGYAARDTLDALLVECFMRPDNISSAGIQLSNRAELMQELLNYGLSNPSTAISLKDLSKAMLKSSSSIAKASREQFGVSPIQLLKQIRLQQVQNLLMDRERQQQLGTQSISSIAQRYGFTAPNHFARDFRTMFGESPRQTFSGIAA